MMRKDFQLKIPFTLQKGKKFPTLQHYLGRGVFKSVMDSVGLEF